MAEVSESRSEASGSGEPAAGRVGEQERRVKTRVVKDSAPRPRGGRYYPSSSSLPGFLPRTRSRTCRKCGFEAFLFAERCRCGEPFED